MSLVGMVTRFTTQQTRGTSVTTCMAWRDTGINLLAWVPFT